MGSLQAAVGAFHLLLHLPTITACAVYGVHLSELVATMGGGKTGRV